MPIMNGFETCRKICELYDKDKKLFKMLPNMKILEDINFRPFMVACTGFLDEKTENECKLAGFDIAI